MVIADFGLAQLADPEHRMHLSVLDMEKQSVQSCTLNYRAPELLLEIGCFGHPVISRLVSGLCPRGALLPACVATAVLLLPSGRRAQGHAPEAPGPESHPDERHDGCRPLQRLLWRGKDSLTV